jgi:alkanesulfonate monooxygenase SsuD/methylene tetrahydromethanopterin reductase-like flavin-dependent oxidoreductase (luciferase family)
VTAAPSLLYFPNQITPDELRTIALEAEAAGFDTLWSTEEDYDSFAYDLYTASVTARLRAGSSIARYYKRHPLLVAETAAAIDRIAPGRFVIGLGTGPVRKSDPGAKLQRWGTDASSPVERLSEYIDVIRMALSGETVDFEGNCYAVQGVTLQPKPERVPPVYLSAGGRELVRLAGRKADGFFFFFLGPALLDEWLTTAREEAQQAGRDGNALVAAGLIPMCIDDDRERARSVLRHHLFFPYLSRPYYQKLLAENGFAEAADAIRTALSTGGVEAAAPLVPDEVLDTLTVGGTPDECVERVREFVARGNDAPVLYPFPVDDDWAGCYSGVVDLFRGAQQKWSD